MRIAIRSCNGLNHHRARDENVFRRILRLLEAPVCATQIVENHPAAASHKHVTNKDELHAPSDEANLRKGIWTGPKVRRQRLCKANAVRFRLRLGLETSQVTTAWRCESVGRDNGKIAKPDVQPNYTTNDQYKIKPPRVFRAASHTETLHTEYTILGRLPRVKPFFNEIRHLRSRRQEPPRKRAMPASCRFFHGPARSAPVIGIGSWGLRLRLPWATAPSQGRPGHQGGI